MSDFGGFLGESGGRTKPNHASIIHRLSQLAIEQARLYYEAKLNEARQAANEAKMNQVKLELDAALMEDIDGSC